MTFQASNEIINNDLLLIGFSKGCVVLNQFLHEFHFYQNQKELNNDMGKFISRIKEIWWLDGGHPGKKDTWITDEKILESFIKMGIYSNLVTSVFIINSLKINQGN